MSTRKRVLILIKEKASEKDKNWDFFRAAVQSAIGEDVEIVMGELVALTFELDGLRSKVYDRNRGWSLEDFDLVVFRFIRKEFALASACASHLIAHGVPYIDTHTQPAGKSKYSAALLRQSVGLPSIPTVHGSHATLVTMIEQAELPFDYPLIIKDNNGRKGRLNFIARSQEAALQIFRENQETDFIIQAYIPNEGDYRILVFGGKPVLALYRRSQEESHLNNTSQGATADLVPVDAIDPTIVTDVIQAAAVEKFEVAGVDAMIDRVTGRHYILEVNQSPQLATGAFPDLKLKAYADYLRSLL